MPAIRLRLASYVTLLLPSALLFAEPPLETVKFKDKFTLLFPSGYQTALDSDHVLPSVAFVNAWDSLHRVEAKVCRPDQQEKKFSMEKIFWASGISTDEIQTKEQLPNGDFFLTGKHQKKVTAAYFNKGPKGYLQVTVEGPDSLALLLAKIARSLKSVERKTSVQQALPLKLVEFVYEKDSVRLLVPDGARPDTSKSSAYYLPIDELDNLRVYAMSGFDYPYDETGKWLGAASDEREVVSNKIVNFGVHVLQLKPKGGKQEFYCYLGKNHENKIVVTGPREYTEVMKLMAESVGVRSASGSPSASNPPRQAASPTQP